MSWVKHNSVSFLFSFGLLGLVQAQELDVRARVSHYEPAHCPGVARIAGLEGTAEALVRVSASGRVTSVEVLGATHALFREPAKLAAWLSTYSPAIRNGVAIADSVHLTFRFSVEPDWGSSNSVEELVNREQIVELVPNQVCLYGNWLSGPVLVRISEDRVYVDGIRVFPAICPFRLELCPELAMEQVMREQLVFECRLFERELALRGLSLEQIRVHTLAMLRKLPNVENVALVTPNSLRIEISGGGEHLLMMPDPYDREGYFALQPQMASAVDGYFGWLSSLHPGLGGRFVLFTHGVTRTMSLGNEIAIEIREYLASSVANEHGGQDLPLDSGKLGPSLDAAIRCPLNLERI